MIETITCPECNQHMDYYAHDATCTCTECMILYDVWDIGKTSANITPDNSWLYLIKGAEQWEIQ